MQSQATIIGKPTFDEYVDISEQEIKDHKNPIATCLQRHGFFKTFYVLDSYFENYSNTPKKLYSLFYRHSKCLYSLIKDSLDGEIDDENQRNELQVNSDRMKQFLQFMYRADIECESTRETLEKLKIEQNIDSFANDDELLDFVFVNGSTFDVERNKFKQVLLDTIQHYTVVNRSKNYRFDFEILLGFYRLLFERHNYFAPARSDPGQATQDALGQTDLYSELMVECGLTTPNQ